MKVFLMRTMIVLGAGFLLTILLAPQVAHAGGVVGNGTPGSCTDSAFQTVFALGGKVTFNCGTSKTILVTPKVAGVDTTVDGGGKITLSGNNVNRIFGVVNGAKLTLKNLTIYGGSASAGGAIYNSSSTLVIINTKIQTSAAHGSGLEGGGAIYSDGTLTVKNSMIDHNAATIGGGIRNNGTALIINSAIVTNSADDTSYGMGGGIANYGTLTVVNSTISGNNSINDGGGIWNENAKTVNIYNATIAYNAADSELNGFGQGGGITNWAGTVTMNNSILAFNTDSLYMNPPGIWSPKSSECAGYVSLGGSNILYNYDTGYCIPSGPFTLTDPLLKPLKFNGGSTQTHALKANSPAIDKGSGKCKDQNGNALTVDQRGKLRPTDGDGNGSARCDIGAFEVQP